MNLADALIPNEHDNTSLLQSAHDYVHGYALYNAPPEARNKEMLAKAFEIIVQHNRSKKP